jgi:putative PIN family toxin of toxin-antitoxin system
LKIVLDTNILISYGLGNKDAKKLLDYITSGDYEVVADERLLHEYKNIPLRKKFGFSKDIIKLIDEWINDNILIKQVKSRTVKFNPDRQDSKIIEIAESFACKYIITDDKQILNRASHLTGAKILNLNSALDLFINTFSH